MALGTQRRIRECLVGHSAVGVAAEGASIPVDITNGKKFCLPTSIKYSLNRESEQLGGGREWAAFPAASDASLDMEVFSVPHDTLIQYFGYPDNSKNVGGVECRGYLEPVNLIAPFVAIGYVDQQISTDTTDPNANAVLEMSYVVKIALRAQGTIQEQTSTSKPNTEKPDANSIPIHFVLSPVYDATIADEAYTVVIDGKRANNGKPLTEAEAQHILYTLFKVERAVHVDLGDGEDHIFNLRVGHQYNINDIIAGLQDPTGENRPIARMVNTLTREVIERGTSVVPVVGATIGPAIAQFLGNIAGQYIGSRLQVEWGEAPGQQNINNENNDNDNDA